MSAPTNSSLERITEALSAGRIAEAKEIIRGLSPEESRNVEEANIAQGRALMEARARALRIKFVDEAGETSLFRIGRDLHPMSRVFEEYASANGVPLDALRFSLNGEVLPVDGPMTAGQLGMNEEDNNVIRVKVLKDRLPKRKPVSTISFVDEVGAKLDLAAQPNLHMYRLFQTYSEMRGMGLVWTLLQFSYKGRILPKHCDATLSQLEMADGDIVYVQRNMPSREQLDEATKEIPQLTRDLPPHSFVNHRVADEPIDTPGEGGLPSEEIGTVVSYLGHGHDTIWTAEYRNNITKQYTRDELIRCAQRYYEKDGFESDMLAYLEQQAERLQLEIMSLKQREDADADASILRALKLEEEIEQLHILVAAWHTFLGMQALWLLKQDLLDARRALVMNGIRSKANKPILKAGETVFAKLRPNGSSNAEPSWMRGRVAFSQCFFKDYGYGPRREYCVRFDNGDVREGIAEDRVTHEAEYRTKRDFSESKWIGVERRVDSESTDPWASKVGWYVAEIDGIEEPFTHLTDALRAHDAHTVADEPEEGELNNVPSDGWHSVFEELKAQEVAAIDIRWKQQMRVRLLLLREQVAHNSDMHAIGSSLFHWANQTPRYDEEWFEYALAHQYKECEGAFLDGDATFMRENLYAFALMLQCVEEGMDFDQLCRLFIGVEGNIERFLCMVPVFRKGYDAASEGVNEMMAYLRRYEPPHADDFWLVNIVDAGNHFRKRYVTEKQSPLKEVLANYALLRGTAVTSLGIELGGRRVFLSTIGKKSSEALGMTEDDVVKVAVLQTAPPETAPKEPQRKPHRHKSKGKGKKARTKSKKKRPHNVELPVNDEERTKTLWLDAISRVFVEADPQFREIRQRLSALSLQRTAPKQRRSRPKEEAAAEAVHNPPSDGLGGKAGKSQFIVQVGEVANLYKTAKPSAARNQSSGQIAREVDLHGCTTVEALAKLDECLPEWVDVAMKGEYPWVIAVRIVCGGGSQTLAEAVEGWIRQSPNVSNAPKNLFS